MQANSQGLLIEVPLPLETRHLLEASTSFFMASTSRALAIAGTFTSFARTQPRDPTTDILRTPQSFFHAFHREMARNNVLQIRGYHAKNASVLEPHNRTRQDQETTRHAREPLSDMPRTSSLWIKSALPPGLDLGRLKTFIDAYHLTWDEPPFTNLQRNATRTGFAELFLNPADVHQLLFRSQATHQEKTLSFELPQLQSPLPAWLLQHKAQFAVKGSNVYQPPSLGVLLYFDEEVLTPLLHLLQSQSSDTAWLTQYQDELRAIHAAAQTYGYQLVYQPGAHANDPYLLLTEIADMPHQRRHWGTFVWRIRQPHRHIVQVPHAMMEPDTLAYGLTLFERLRGHALLVSGAHAEANLDGSSDVLNTRHPQNLFNLVHQVTLREHPQNTMLVIQSRGFAYHLDRPQPSADILMAFHHGMSPPKTLPTLGLQLFHTLQQDGLDVRLVDGSVDTTGYGPTGVLQSKYMDATSNKTFVILWLSPTVRSHYRQQSDNRSLAAQFNALQIPTLVDHLSDYIRKQARWGHAGDLPVGLKHQLRNYIADQDIIRLHQLTQHWADHRFERLLDQNTDQAFLLVFTPSDTLALVANLNPREITQTLRADRTRRTAMSIAQFVDTQALWLELEGP
jgi:hypothetical protein